MSNESPEDISEIEVSRNWKKLITPSLLILLVIVVVYLSNVSNVWFTSQKIIDYNIIGTNLSDSNKFFEIAKEISFQKSKDSVLLKLIENKIEKDDYISNCVATFSGEDRILIKVEEREPFVFFKSINGLDYIDIEGNKLPYKVLANYADMIIISGIKLSDTLLLNKALNISSHIYNNKTLSNIVSEINFIDEDKGFQFIGVFENNTIYFGLNKNVERKIEKLNILYKNESSKLALNENNIVDLRWYNRIVLSKK